MGEKIGGTNPMYEIRPGLSRGHMPRDASPEEVAEQVRKDELAKELSDQVLKNLNEKSKDVF